MIKRFHINTPNHIIPQNSTTRIIRENHALDFHRSLSTYKPTPLIELGHLANKYNVGGIYFKDESKRFGLNAFKGLGASFAIYKSLIKKPDIDCFCTATDGNHGRAVAWAAKKYNKKSIVFVPKMTTPQRIDAIKQEGATVIQTNGNYDETCQEAMKMSKLKNWTLIQDTSWKGYIETPALIVSGYITLFEELENSLHTTPNPKIDMIFLQAGVGSMAASAVYYYLNKYSRKKPKIVIVEPEEADGILYSFQNGKILPSKGNCKTIMAGLNCETPSLGVWDLLKNGVDYSIKIKDSFTIRAMQELYFPLGSDKRIIAGESGAAGFAGFLSIINETDFEKVYTDLKINSEKNILFINTEGDTDSTMFKQIMETKN